ncbi:MAG: efflux RND transporter periplasmic adaptor subunit [Lentisphaeria bacterium]|nr:efflux RND transporter periplasmic adaptor subunit [Lentisphaeria bacterium]
MKKPAKVFIFVLLPALLLAGGLYYGIRVYKHKSVSADRAVSKDPDRTYRVVKGDMTLGLRLNGTIVANKKHKLGLEANFATQILSVVDENTPVKEGDVLIEFEDSDLIERIEEMRTTLSNTEEELVIAIENEKIQERKNEVTLREAEDRVRQAESDQRKYLRLTRTQKRDSNDLAIANAEANLATAKKNYSDKKYDIAHSGVTDEAARKANENELKNLQSKIESTENSLNQAEIDAKSFKHYDDPIKLMSLNNSLEQARLNLEQARISTSSALVQAKKRVDNLRANSRRQAATLERYESYLPMMKLTAPTDGIVIYGDPDRRWGGEDIKPGLEVRKGEILLTIPEMTNLMVNFDLPEAFRSKVQIGNQAIITPEAITTLKIKGQITEIATLPVNQMYWDETSPKIYPSRISLEVQDPQLVNGMSVIVEIVSSILHDVISVPMEAVFENDKGFFVFVNKNGNPEEVPVTIGDSNDTAVCITEGLESGDVVYLYRPYQKKQSDQ